MTRTLLVFIDGLGWGEPTFAGNPGAVYGGRYFRLPARGDGRPVSMCGGGWARPIDAVLGVPGIPQSATGQTTLLAGVNSQQVLGKHLTGFPNEILRAILLERSILRAVADRGRRARFLNAYRPRFWDLSRERQLTLSATTVANLAGDLPFHTLDDLRNRRSIYQDFTNADLIARGFDVPTFTPRQAGRILARAARKNDFTLFEYFLSDKAGHSGDMDRARAELTKLDVMLDATLQELSADLDGDMLVAVTSDHGNVEDMTTRRHTTNPVPLMAWGSGAEAFVGRVTRLDQVAPALLDTMDRA